MQVGYQGVVNPSSSVGLYRPPSFTAALAESIPPQTIISEPVQIPVWRHRAVGAASGEKSGGPDPRRE